jgi:hypothetical protein
MKLGHDESLEAPAAQSAVTHGAREPTGTVHRRGQRVCASIVAYGITPQPLMRRYMVWRSSAKRAR